MQDISHFRAKRHQLTVDQIQRQKCLRSFQHVNTCRSQSSLDGRLCCPQQSLQIKPLRWLENLIRSPINEPTQLQQQNGRWWRLPGGTLSGFPGMKNLVWWFFWAIINVNFGFHFSSRNLQAWRGNRTMLIWTKHAVQHNWIKATITTPPIEHANRVANKKYLDDLLQLNVQHLIKLTFANAIPIIRHKSAWCYNKTDETGDRQPIFWTKQLLPQTTQICKQIV